MKAFKLIKGRLVPSQAEIAQEEPLIIRINGHDYATLMTSPCLEKELALGFCFSEGIINTLREVAVLHFCGSGDENKEFGRIVAIKLVGNQESLPKRNLEVRSSCGICGRVLLGELCEQLTAIKSNLTVTPNLLFQMNIQMQAFQSLFKDTGSTHAAALFNPQGKILAHAEDLGRHNALDKVIGKGILTKIPFPQSILLLSGRNSYEMTMKSLRAQIPIVASISGATTLAIQLAERMGCTLIGFLREPNMEIYTHHSRLLI